MAIRSLSLELDLDAGKFTAKMTDAAGETTKFSRAVDGASGSLKKMEAGAGSNLGKLRDLTVILGQARAAAMTLNEVFLSWGENMVTTASQMEKTSKMLQGMSDSMDNLGRTKDATKQMDYLFNLAKTSPFSLGHLTDAFVKLKSTGIDPMKGTLQGIIEAVARFGGSDQQLERAALAIQQMAGKGVVSMEELRRQLGEAVPTAMNAMAAGMGMSYGALTKAIQNGTVESKSAIAKMIAVFNLAYGGSALAMMDTFSGRMAVLKTTWQQTAMAIVGLNRDGTTVAGSFFDTLKKGITDVTDALGKPEFKLAGYQIGQMMTSAANGIGSFVKEATGLAGMVPILKIVTDNLKILAIVIATDLVFSALGKMKTALVDGYGAFAKFGTVAAGVVENFRYLGGAIAEGGVRFKDTTTILELAKLSLKGFGVATLNLIPVIGSIVAVLMTAADAFGWFKNKADEARKAEEEFSKTGFTTPEALKSMSDSIEQRGKAIASLKQQLSSGWSTDLEGNRTPMKSDEVAAKTKELGELESLQADEKRIRANASRALADQTATDKGNVDAGIAMRQQGIDKLTQQAKDVTNALTKFNDAHKNDANANELITAEHAKAANENERIFAQISAGYEKAAAPFRKYIQTHKEGTDEYARNWAALKKIENDQNTFLNTKSPQALLDPVTLVNGQKGGKSDAATDKLSQLKEQLAQLQAQIKGVYGEAAKMQVALDIDPKLLKSMTPAKAAEIMNVAHAIDAAKKQLQGMTAYNRLTGLFDQKMDGLDELETTLTGLAGTTDVNVQETARFNAMVDRLADRARAAGVPVAELAKKVEALKEANAQFVRDQDAIKNINKLDTDITGYSSQADSIFSQIVGGKDKINKEYETYRRNVANAVNALIADANGDQKKIADAMWRGNQAVSSFAQAQAGQAAADMLEKAKSINTDLVKDNAEKARQSTQTAIQEMFNRVEWDKLTADQRKQTEKAYWDYVQAMQRKGAEDAKGPLEKMADQWNLLGENMQQAATGWVGDFVDGLATGKLSMTDFVTSVLEGIAKVILQALIAKAIIATLGAFGMTGSQAVSSINIPTAGNPVVTAHTGGVPGFDSGMASMLADPSWFQGAPRYHTGGIAGLRPGEIPAILKHGEGVFTPEQMKALGTKSAGDAPNVQVNVINNSGQKLDAQQQQSHFDGRSYIVDVVVDAASKPGKMRDMLSGLKS